MHVTPIHDPGALVCDADLNKPTTTEHIFQIMQYVWQLINPYYCS